MLRGDALPRTRRTPLVPAPLQLTMGVALGSVFCGYPNPSPNHNPCKQGPGRVAQVLSFLPLSLSLSRKIRTACGFFFGRFGLPLPHATRIVSVVGAPILGARCATPCPAVPDRAQGKQQQALECLHGDTRMRVSSHAAHY